MLWATAVRFNLVVAILHAIGIDMAAHINRLRVLTTHENTSLNSSHVAQSAHNAKS
jgi:hypothetical protein